MISLCKRLNQSNCQKYAPLYLINPQAFWKQLCSGFKLYFRMSSDLKGKILQSKPNCLFSSPHCESSLNQNTAKRRRKDWCRLSPGRDGSWPHFWLESIRSSRLIRIKNTSHTWCHQENSLTRLEQCSMSKNPDIISSYCFTTKFQKSEMLMGIRFFNNSRCYTICAVMSDRCFESLKIMVQQVRGGPEQKKKKVGLLSHSIIH